MRWFIPFLLLLITFQAKTQQLYQVPAGVQSRVSSFENLNGTKGQGGRSNRGAKGHAYEQLKAGDSKDLLNIQAAGIVQRIWCTFSDRSPWMLRALRLRMYWDGTKKPAVDVPLGDFFGVALEPTPFQSALLSNPEGRSFNCIIPMPFRTAARIVITNESNKDLDLLFFDIDYIILPKIESQDLYFHACWTRTQNAPIGTDAVLLPKVNGRGRFLGVSVGVKVNNAYGFSWWGEGEFKAWLDGDTTFPTINGTGSEDYIGTGWGEEVFVNQYQGCLVADTIKNQYAFYRFHIPDAIYFQHDCKITIQQIGGYFADYVKKLQESRAILKPIFYSDTKGDRRLLEPGQESALGEVEPHDWLNFYRSDDYAATAYFYLDKAEGVLPDLAPMADRCMGLNP